MKLMCNLFGHKWKIIKRISGGDYPKYIEKCKRVVSTYNAWGNILIISLSDFDGEHV